MPRSASASGSSSRSGSGFGRAGRGAAPLPGGHARDPADPVARRAPRRGRGRGARARALGGRGSRLRCSACSPTVPGRGSSPRGRSRGPPSSRTAAPAPTASPDGARPRRARSSSARQPRRARRSLVPVARPRRDAAGATWCAASSARRLSSSCVGAARARARGRQPVQLGGRPARRLRRGRQRPGPARQPRDEQPHRLVGRGVAGLPRPPGRRDGRAHVRDRAQALPRQRPERERAAQRPAAAARRRRACPAFVLGLGLRRWRSCSGFALPCGGSRPEERAAAVGAARAPARVRPPRARRLRPRLPRRRRADGLVAAALLGAGRPARVGAQPVARRSVAAVVAAVVAVWVLAAPALSTRAVDRAYRQADAGDLDGGRRLGSPRPEPEPALARAALRPRHRRVAGGATIAAAERALRAGDAAPAREPATPGTSSGSSASSRSATSAAPTSRSTPRTRSIRAAACSRRRARSTWRAAAVNDPAASGLRAVGPGAN